MHLSQPLILNILIALSSAVIDTVGKKLTSSKMGMAFLYCSYAEKIDQTIEELIGSLIQQLLLRQHVIPKDILKFYNSHKRSNTPPDYSELSEHLRSSVSLFSKVYIIVDALDECDEGNKTRRELLAQLQSLDGRVQLFFTSRRLGDLENLLSGAIQFEIRAQEEDMRKYLSAQIEREDNLVELCKTHEDLRDEMLRKIIAKADGMLVLQKNSSYRSC